MKRIVVIGAGVGGLTAASLLAKAGFEVTVLEAHVYPGGCAATFYHAGYHFDAGATLAGGFGPGGVMESLARALDMPAWRAQPASPSMIVHMPDGASISRWGDARRWQEREQAFAPGDMTFWRWQESTAEALWAVAQANPPWPPRRVAEWMEAPKLLIRHLHREVGLQSWPGLIADGLLPVSWRLRAASDVMRTFIDAQLLISAQATSRDANALYAAAALDLPRRGVVHLEGGMGAIAEALKDRLQAFGGSIHFKQRAVRVRQQRGSVVAVETLQGDSFPADLVVGNLPPWNFARLFDGSPPRFLRAAANTPLTGWGAFVLYLGVDGDALAGQGAGHHQIILRKPMGEGNTAFLSISPDWDLARAPSGSRAVTMSTHTRMAPWWELFHADREAYEARKESYTERLLSAADRIYPRLKDAVDLALPGTPVSFRRHTGRERGWVGGFPQTSLFKGLPSRLREDVWLVGDSIFPGQSTAAVALGGMRVAEGIQITGGAAKWGDPHPIVDGTMHSVENLERECAMPGDGAEV